MKKFAICADVHWSQYSSIVRSRGEVYSTRLENLIRSVNWFENLAVEKNCDEVFYLGDTLDRPDLNAEEITALQEIKFSSLPHSFLVGNHDSNIADLKYSSTNIFKSLGAEVIDLITCKEVSDKVDIYFIPYLTGDRIKPLKTFLKDDNKKKIILAHDDLAGIQYGRFMSQSGFNVEDILENCNLFLNGHLHNGCIIGDKIILVGNLTGQNFNEDATKYNHYAYIMTVYDDGKIELDPIINPHAFNFYKVYITKEEDLDLFNSLKDNSVLSIICNPRLLSKVNEIIKSTSQIIEYRITSLYSKNTGDDEIVDFTIEDHLQQFIDYVQTKIEPSEVLTEELSRLSNS